jgi:NadR type nicotinamide-nucleotide adenylyltransferase
MDKTVKIVITGAESTGKSTLSEALSTYFQAKWIPEFSRSYVENLHRNYTCADVEKIARHQIEEEKDAEEESGLVFFDTWLIITKVWFEFVYGKCPGWIHNYIRESNIDLFLLCDIDIPWVSDPVRENGGENRKILQEIYRKQIELYGFRYQVVSGIGDERLKNAITIIEQFLNETCH